MREVLFRGKRVDNGEWVVGSLLWQGKGKAYIIEHDCDFGVVAFCEECCVPYDASFGGRGSQFEVSPETICEYTGLTDRNDKKIFEGDIIKCTLWRVLKIFEVRYVVAEAQFRIKNSGGDYGMMSSAQKTYEVVGNIHDTPELLEGNK